MDELAATRFRLQLMSLHRRLRAEHVEEVSLQSILTLGAIDRLGPEASPSALAHDLKVARPNMSTLLHRLQSEGLISTDAAPHDGRRRIVALTATGTQLVERDRGNREKWLRHAASEILSKPEIELLLRAGELMQRLAEAPTESETAPRKDPRS